MIIQLIVCISINMEIAQNYNPIQSNNCKRKHELENRLKPQYFNKQLTQVCYSKYIPHNISGFFRP